MFIAVGFILDADGLIILRIHIDGERLRRLAELTLAMFLFTDAANVDFSKRKRSGPSTSLKFCYHLIQINREPRQRGTVDRSRMTEVGMPSSAVRIFTDPDAYHAARPHARAEGVITGRGKFRAESTTIRLNRLSLERCEETLPKPAKPEPNRDFERTPPSVVRAIFG